MMLLREVVEGFKTMFLKGIISLLIISDFFFPWIAFSLSLFTISNEFGILLGWFSIKAATE